MAPKAARLIVAPENELEFGKELGSGAFGTVYEVSHWLVYLTHCIYSSKGYWKPDGDENEYHVAIKVLKNASANASRELLQVSHWENIVCALLLPRRKEW